MFRPILAGLVGALALTGPVMSSQNVRVADP
jgi:hypothetical protein